MRKRFSKFMFRCRAPSGLRVFYLFVLAAILMHPAFAHAAMDVPAVVGQLGPFAPFMNVFRWICAGLGVIYAFLGVRALGREDDGKVKLLQAAGFGGMAAIITALGLAT